MKRKCNLELRLVTPSSDISSYYYGQYKLTNTNPFDQKQQLTIFYNGIISACDVTELQARAIISLASQETGKISNNPPGPDPCSPMVNTPLYNPTASLSMKRSLQRFLQKRKTRAQATTPYHIHLRHSS